MKKLRLRAPANRRENTVGALAAMHSPRRINTVKPSASAATPAMPNSSAKAAKMKSVVRSGMNSRCVCVPLMKPLPVSPPEPMAIMPWMM